MKTPRLNTDLRRLCLHILYEAGFAGPPYNLDDIDPTLYYDDDSVSVVFYDMDTTVYSDNKNFKSLLEFKNIYLDFKEKLKS